MKTNAPLFPARRAWPLALGLLAGGLAVSQAAPLPGIAAVQTKPEAGAPVITTLPAGAEPVPAPDSALPAPAGWLAVDVPGPFAGYVLNKDFTKALDVRTGSPIFLAPKPDAGVLAVAARDDKIEITGLDGKWTQVRLNRDLVGYIEVAAPTDEAPPPPAPASAAPIVATDAAAATDAPGKPADVAATSQPFPRYFEGRVTSSRRLLPPRPPYPWQLDDGAGERIAYLDLSQLLLTEQIQQYAGRDVLVFGPVRTAADGRNLVIEVQSLQLK